MSATSTVAHDVRRRQTPDEPRTHANGNSPAAITLGLAVDRLADLRSRLKTLEADERRLTGEIMTAMRSARTRTLQGATALAILDYRHTVTVDAARFYRALGDKALAAMSVKVTEARRLMADDDLEKISEATTTPTLTVRSLGNGGGA